MKAKLELVGSETDSVTVQVRMPGQRLGILMVIGEVRESVAPPAVIFEVIEGRPGQSTPALALLIR